MQTEALTSAQIEKVQAVSLEILERVGVIVPHNETLTRFADAGAKVDPDSKRVRIPADLVTSALQSTGKQFTLYGRDRTRIAEFGSGKRNYNSIAGEALWIVEPGGERRYACLEDVKTAARFGDAMQHINIVGAMADPHEIPPAVRCVEVLRELILNTTKPVTFWFHDRASARYVVEMLIALRGSEKEAAAFPLCYPFLEPISPLRFPRDGIDLLYETARLNLPVPIGPMAQMGVSAPMSAAGTLALENAEILAGICITQLIRPGMPVCYGGICHAFDMKTTQMIFGGPEQAFFGVAMTQIGKAYGLPVYINVGLTDSKRPDAQAGLEAGVTLALGAAAGADIFGHMGISGVDQAASLDMLALQNEIIGYVESATGERGFSDEDFALDQIVEAGPGGSYIDTDHTATNFRGELWFPRLLDRNYYETWHRSGAEDTETRCRRNKEGILAEHSVEPASPDLERSLDEIVADARRELLPVDSPSAQAALKQLRM